MMWYDINGRALREGTIEQNTINHNLGSGTYILKITNDNKVSNRKIIVK